MHGSLFLGVSMGTAMIVWVRRSWDKQRLSFGVSIKGKDDRELRAALLIAQHLAEVQLYEEQIKRTQSQDLNVSDFPLRIK
ncbi:hypothetical protein Tco_0896628 [Tanacetum coccineum]